MTVSTVHCFEIRRPRCQGVGSDAFAARASGTYTHSTKNPQDNQKHISNI